MKYYCFVAGLKELSPTDERLPFSWEALREMLDDVLGQRDKRTVEQLMWQTDNRNLSGLLDGGVRAWEPGGTLTEEEMRQDLETLHREGRTGHEKMPQYMAKFVEEQDGSTENVATRELKLYEAYYAEMGKCRNAFVREWMNLDRTLRNVTAAVACRKYGWNVEQHVIGTDELTDDIRKSKSKDMGLEGAVDYAEDIVKAMGVENLYERERMLDQIRWDWLDEKTFHTPFSEEKVMAYILQFRILMRYVKMDENAGRERFVTLARSMSKKQ